MKKLLFFVFLSLVCQQAKAENTSLIQESKPFLGFELSSNSVGMTDGLDQDVEDSFSSVAVLLGTKIQAKTPLSFALFYQKSAKKEKSSYGWYSSEADFYAFGIDASAYFPINKKTDLFGTLGLGRYEFSVSDNFNRSLEEEHIGARFGIGLEYKMAENLALNGSLRYVKFDYDSKTDYIEDMTEFGIGIKMSF